MKPWLLTLLLSLSSLPGWRWLLRVRDHNATQVQGQVAAQRGRAAEAAYYFEQAAALTAHPTPALLLDLAQAQGQAGHLARARATYARLLDPTVPAAVGSAARQQLAGLLARQGQVAQAVGLLRQALRLNPANAAARYNYEALSQYLAEQRPPAAAPPPPAGPPPTAPPTPPDTAGQAPKPGGRQPTGGSRQGQPSAEPSAAPPQPGAGGPQAPQPAAEGLPNSQLPSPAPGRSAQGRRQPGAGEAQPLPSGAATGLQRGLDPTGAGGAAVPNAAGRRPGTAAATEADAQLQTQRERLKAMNLSPAQAQQLLDALRASEQQYLQQRPRVRRGAPPAPGQPTW